MNVADASPVQQRSCSRHTGPVPPRSPPARKSSRCFARRESHISRWLRRGITSQLRGTSRQVVGWRRQLDLRQTGEDDSSTATVENDGTMTVEDHANRLTRQIVAANSKMKITKRAATMSEDSLGAHERRCSRCSRSRSPRTDAHRSRAGLGTASSRNRGKSRPRRRGFAQEDWHEEATTSIRRYVRRLFLIGHGIEESSHHREYPAAIQRGSNARNETRESRRSLAILEIVPLDRGSATVEQR